MGIITDPARELHSKIEVLEDLEETVRELMEIHERKRELWFPVDLLGPGPDECPDTHLANLRARAAGIPDPARAALGIASNGNLIWAAGEHMTVAALADALMTAHVVRAVELDINPEWVAGYLYAHHGRRRLVPLPVVTGQFGIPGEFLAPWSRDFFSVDVR